MRVNRLSIGDIYEIQLPDQRYTYGQLVYVEHGRTGHGYLVRIFDKIVVVPIANIEEICNAGEMFPTIFVGLMAAIRSVKWRKIAHHEVKNFNFPMFRHSNGLGPGIFHDWVLYDGVNEIRIGDLPSEYRSLELLCIWGYELLAERIVTGINPFEGTDVKYLGHNTK